MAQVAWSVFHEISDEDVVLATHVIPITVFDFSAKNFKNKEAVEAFIEAVSDKGFVMEEDEDEIIGSLNGHLITAKCFCMPTLCCEGDDRFTYTHRMVQ